TIYALDPTYQSMQSVRMLGNTPCLEPNFWGIRRAAGSRLENNSQRHTSLNLGRSRGNLGNSFGASVGNTRIYQTPNGLINAYGPLDMDAPVQIKFQGTYFAPLGLALSLNYTGVSGFPVIIPDDFPSDYAGAYTVRFTN